MQQGFHQKPVTCGLLAPKRPLTATRQDFTDRILVCGQQKLVALMELLVLDDALTAFPLPRPVTIIFSHS